jgi:NAD(P)-dependent dehydrogenase (short-subunit alcohol dehydrogenase family)
METVLIVGASRGLGLGLAREYVKRGRRVIGTVRDLAAPTGLHNLAMEAGSQVQVEMVDINIEEQVAALRNRLNGETIDVLMVNAGISNGPKETVPHTSTQAFITLMLTNALSPLRVIETFADLVPPEGIIAAMSSSLGSVTSNDRGGYEIYRASKAALNMMLRSFSIRRGEGRTILAVVPGWVRTELGGPDAPLDVDTSVRGVVDAIAARRGRPGSAYIDYRGNDLAW